MELEWSLLLDIIYIQRIGYLQVTLLYLPIDTIIYVSLRVCPLVLLFFFPTCFCFVLFFAPHPFSLLTLLRSSND